ncbi:hypothetical protein ACFY8Z_25440 [Streptomyces microflavus]|uniref:hypothetical protein n=1 Tax=Streptomyces microflavus TaxID=1919 RepID=UPI0036E4DC7A
MAWSTKGRTQPGRRLRHQQPLGERRVGRPEGGRRQQVARHVDARHRRLQPRPVDGHHMAPPVAGTSVTGSRPTATSSRPAATVTVPPRAVRTTVRTPSSTTSVSSSRAPGPWLRALGVFSRVLLTGAAAALAELLTTLPDTGIRPLRPFRPGAPSPERAYVDCAGPPSVVR